MDYQHKNLILLDKIPSLYAPIETSIKTTNPVPVFHENYTAQNLLIWGLLVQIPPQVEIGRLSPILSKTSRNRPFWDKKKKHTLKTTFNGIWAAFCQKLMQLKLKPQGLLHAMFYIQ